jgi:hypothetical protein
MNRFVSLFGAMSLFFAAQASIACDYPERVQIPNGSTATQDEMLGGQADVKQFVTKMEAYLECILKEEKAARAAIEDLTPEVEMQREDMLTKKYNAAVDEMEKTAANFNNEVQAYKARNN